MAADHARTDKSGEAAIVVEISCTSVGPVLKRQRLTYGKRSRSFNVRYGASCPEVVRQAQTIDLTATYCFSST